MIPYLVFASPRKLPKPADLSGRVVVLDVAFAADGIGPGFAKTTQRFIDTLGARLACWVDHHDHPAHVKYQGDSRFVLSTKAEHGACPEMISPQLVAQVGPVETIVAHFDLDGIYAAAKWILEGKEPYVGADDDARAVDTRIGAIGPVATMIDHALRARWSDPVLQNRIIRFLVSGQRPGVELDTIQEASAEFAKSARGAQELAKQYQIVGKVALLKIPAKRPPFDKTELLLLGQKRALVAIVVDGGNMSIAADFESGLNFLELFSIGGGMPTRVSLPEKRLPGVLEILSRNLGE